jgi:NADH-quinone oxidoreductase subunit D
LRKDIPYLSYNEFDFNVVTEEDGDCYARYRIRLAEIRESMKIVEQAIAGMPEGEINIDSPKLVLPSKESVLTSMEELIHHFKIASEGIRIPPCEIYSGIESTKGELGFYLRSDGTNKPYRLRIKSPSFYNIQVIPELAKRHMLADMTAIISSIDPVMGECDK